MQELLLVRGLPGSGKSDLCEALVAKFPHVVHLEPSMYMSPFTHLLLRQANEWVLSEASRNLVAGRTVIVANVFAAEHEWKPYINMVKHVNDALGLSIETKIITCKGHSGRKHGIPDEIIQRMKERWIDVDS